MLGCSLRPCKRLTRLRGAGTLPYCNKRSQDAMSHQPIAFPANRYFSRRAVLAGLSGAVLVRPSGAATRLNFSDLLAKPAELSDLVKRVAGTEVEMRGYMAPPLKSEINFFVLTKLPTSTCPFCDSAAAWPDDIVLVQMARPIRAIAYDALIRVTGILDVGEQTDSATGFVSLVRLRDARYLKA